MADPKWWWSARRKQEHRERKERERRDAVRRSIEAERQASIFRWNSVSRDTLADSERRRRANDGADPIQSTIDAAFDAIQHIPVAPAPSASAPSHYSGGHITNSSHSTGGSFGGESYSTGGGFGSSGDSGSSGGDSGGGGGGSGE